MKLEAEPCAFAACFEFLGVAAVHGRGLFQNNHKRPFFFFSGVTKLFPLFPIILAFENTELVLLFAASIYCRL